MANLKHLFFDLDNMLTRSRYLITPEMAGALRAHLENGRNIIVVSGATEEQIFKQIGEGFRGDVYVLAQNGNKAILKNKIGWANELSSAQKDNVFAHIKNIKKEFKEIFKNVKDEKDLAQDRGCQISFSLIGHNEEIGKKEAFDPGVKEGEDFRKDSFCFR